MSTQVNESPIRCILFFLIITIKHNNVQITFHELDRISEWFGVLLSKTPAWYFAPVLLQLSNGLNQDSVWKGVNETLLHHDHIAFVADLSVVELDLVPRPPVAGRLHDRVQVRT